MQKFCAKNQKKEEVYTEYKLTNFYDFVAKISSLGANSYLATGLIKNGIQTNNRFRNSRRAKNKFKNVLLMQK